MTDILFLFASLLFFYFGNKAFNMSLGNKKETDPPTNFNEVENPQIMMISFVLLLAGGWLFYLFFKTM